MKIRFSIRDIIFLTLLVACNLGWYVNKVAPTRILEGQVEMLEGQVEIGNRLITIQKEQSHEQYAKMQGHYEYLESEMEILTNFDVAMRHAVEEILDEKQTHAFYEKMEKKLKELRDDSGH
jgi:hypothetical protein